MNHIHPESGQLRMQDVGVVHEPLRKRIINELAAHPELWNQYKWRTMSGLSPHREADDIWVRYNDIKNFDPANPAAFNEEHEAVWYPCAEKLPSIPNLVEQVADSLGAQKIGAVLVTRVPPGKQIYWHQDGGWHARAHRKFLVLLRGNPEQSFEFENEQMFADEGDCFEFMNEYPHRVLNPTDSERISLIICLRDFKHLPIQGAH